MNATTGKASSHQVLAARTVHNRPAGLHGDGVLLWMREARGVLHLFDATVMLSS